MNDLTLTGSLTGLGQIQSGTTAYHRANLAFFAAGFVTFMTLYDVQPLLPEFAREFQVSPALGSLPLSVSTATLAIAMLFAGTLSETWGRKQMMTGALLLSSALTLATALSHGFVALLAIRLLQGLVLAGLPAVAMAYLGEEMETSAIAPAMGLYIGGNALGGMSGRIFTVIMTEHSSWRSSFFMIGMGCLALSVLFVKSLPSSNLPRRPFDVRYLVSSLVRHLKDRRLLCLYGISFLAMGSFVTMYNYLTFRLLGHPYDLSQSQVGMIFVVYLLGSFSASAMGHFINRFGRLAMLRLSLVFMAAGALLTLAAALSAVICGLAVFTIGFFGAHSVGSSWVGRTATTAKAQASALYLFFYYQGSSISGTAGGWCWSTGSWGGVVALIAGFLLLALLVSRQLAQPQPQAQH
jgi:YNFM family putative membrane transporter